MSDLINYINSHTQRGSCECGRCIDAPEEAVQPKGHTADLIFFKVCAINDPQPEDLRSLIEAEESNLFDGEEHSYLEVGGWIGDQGLALTLMGLGSLLGLWNLLTPRIFNLSEDLVQQMAGQGYISVQANES